MRRAKRGEGRTFEHVFAILEDAGYEPQCLSSVTGYWLKADVYRWEVILKINGFNQCCGCWYSMTEFLKYARKYGFNVHDCEIASNEPESCAC
jgi:hypothetical protein